MVKDKLETLLDLSLEDRVSKESLDQQSLQIIRLHEALNSELETQRQEATEIVRLLIEAIIRTPSDDGMRIDLRGDLAGILTIASGTQKSANAGMGSRFDPKSQVQMVAGACDRRRHKTRFSLVSVGMGEIKDTHQLAA